MKRGRGSTRTLPDDWSEFLGLLVKHRVKFLIVGAHALAAHGRPRFTGDLDVFVEPTRANASRVCRALIAFGFGEHANRDWFATPEEGLHGLQLGVEPYRIDVLKAITGMPFGRAWKHRVRTRLDGLTVHVIGREDYIANKRASGRTKDLLDIALLEEIE